MMMRFKLAARRRGRRSFLIPPAPPTKTHTRRIRSPFSGHYSKRNYQGDSHHGHHALRLLGACKSQKGRTRQKFCRRPHAPTRTHAFNDILTPRHTTGTFETSCGCNSSNFQNKEIPQESHYPTSTRSCAGLLRSHTHFTSPALRGPPHNTQHTHPTAPPHAPK